MATKIYEWAIGKWSNRKTLSYIPVDKKINEKNFRCDLPAGSSTADNIPYMTEDAGEGVYYLTYSSNANAAIIRIREEK